MREIKFRAWDKVRKIIVNVVMLSFEQDVLGFDDSDAIEYGNTRDFELMQYTGLKDVNGVEIYEGDIVKFDTNVQILESEVTYYHGMFTIKKYGEKIPLFTGLKVIGNKFQNPELLEDN